MPLPPDHVILVRKEIGAWVKPAHQTHGIKLMHAAVNNRVLDQQSPVVKTRMRCRISLLPQRG
jgi:hypothetical protein